MLPSSTTLPERSLRRIPLHQQCIQKLPHETTLLSLKAATTAEAAATIDPRNDNCRKRFVRDNSTRHWLRATTLPVWNRRHPRHLCHNKKPTLSRPMVSEWLPRPCTTPRWGETSWLIWVGFVLEERIRSISSWPVPQTLNCNRHDRAEKAAINEREQNENMGGKP